MWHDDDDDIPLDDQDMLDQRELPDPSDMDQDDDVVLSRCPYCKKMIAEESEVCPKCGSFISAEDSQEPEKFPKWFLLGLLVVILIMIFGWVL
jgi:predicted nucleic acid-binding Zn ribbon protein